MRAVLTRYAVNGWGEGELWTQDDRVLAHDFHFSAAVGAPLSPLAAAPPAAAPMGEAEPPSGTVAGSSEQVGDVSVLIRRLAHEPELDPLPAELPLDPHALADRLRAFLAGEEVDLADVALDLGDCTPFQRDVTAALRAIPRSEVVTYGEIAALAGYPRAQRAVGTVCATNRFMLLVPCHRVVAADGIGGYGSAGVAVKRRLLALEGIEL